MTSTPALPFEMPPERSRAEILLSHLASDLLRLPFEGHTRPLHIRALELKRKVDLWTRNAPSDGERRATREEILALQEQANGWRELLR